MQRHWPNLDQSDCPNPHGTSVAATFLHLTITGGGVKVGGVEREGVPVVQLYWLSNDASKLFGCGILVEGKVRVQRSCKVRGYSHIT